MRSIALLLVCFVLVPLDSLRAQSAEEEVMATVQRLFDGMRAGDSTMVRSVFHPEARLLTTGERDGAPTLQVVSIDGFVKAAGTPHEEVWDERIGDVEIRIDDNLATAWMEYAFYRGDEFSHCGINAFQLFRGAEGWEIIQIADTRREEGCETSEG